MKKYALFLMALLLPVLAQAQVARTLADMSSEQVNKVLNDCKKIVVHCWRTVEKGEDVPTDKIQQETFTLIYDYPHNYGCDFYVKGEKYAYFLSRPMYAQKNYKNHQDFRILSYTFFSDRASNIYLSLFFTVKGNSDVVPSLAWYVNNKARESYMIGSVDFYDTSGKVIVAAYDPQSANDIDTGNPLQCFAERAYQRYK